MAESEARKKIVDMALAHPEWRLKDLAREIGTTGEWVRQALFREGYNIKELHKAGRYSTCEECGEAFLTSKGNPSLTSCSACSKRSRHPPPVDRICEICRVCFSVPHRVLYVQEGGGASGKWGTLGRFCSRRCIALNMVKVREERRKEKHVCTQS